MYNVKTKKMNSEALREKPLFLMTAEEFLQFQKDYEKEEFTKNQEQPKQKKKYVYGILGLAKLIDGSKSKANRLKKSGIIDEAIIQNGRKIIIDAELALDLIKKANR